MAEVEIKFNTKSLPDPAKWVKWFRHLRDEELTEAEKTLKSYVDNSILQSGVNDSHGKVRRWQGVYRSKGYVAVRAKSGKTGRDSPGAITNYLENGHRGRQPSGKNARYQPRVHTGRARAFYFYKDIQNPIDRIADQVGERIVEELEKLLEEK